MPTDLQFDRTDVPVKKKRVPPGTVIGSLGSDPNPAYAPTATATLPPEEGPPPMQAGAAYGSQDPAGGSTAYLPQPAARVPPPSDTIDPGALQAHRQGLLTRIDGLRKQRVLLGSRGDRAGATAIAQEENMLLDQLHRANRVMAASRPQQSDAQILAGRASLQAQVPAAVGPGNDQLQRGVDMAQQRVNNARDFFLTKPAGTTEADVFDEGPPSEPRMLTPEQQSLGGVFDRQSAKGLAQAKSDQARFTVDPNKQIDFGPLPDRTPSPTLGFDRSETARAINEGKSARDYAGKATVAGREEELAVSAARLARSRAEKSQYESIGGGTDVGGMKRKIEENTARDQLATSASGGVDSKQIRTAAITGLEHLDSLGRFSTETGLDPVMDEIRGGVFEPLRARAAAGATDVAQIIAEIRPQLKRRLLEKTTTPGSLLWSNRQMAPKIQQLLDELDAIGAAPKLPPEAGPPAL